MITISRACKYEHIPDGCSNIWISSFSTFISPLQVKKNESGVSLELLSLDMRLLILKS